MIKTKSVCFPKAGHDLVVSLPFPSHEGPLPKPSLGWKHFSNMEPLCRATKEVDKTPPSSLSISFPSEHQGALKLLGVKKRFHRALATWTPTNSSFVRYSTQTVTVMIQPKTWCTHVVIQKQSVYSVGTCLCQRRRKKKSHLPSSCHKSQVVCEDAR